MHSHRVTTAAAWNDTAMLLNGFGREAEATECCRESGRGTAAGTKNVGFEWDAVYAPAVSIVFPKKA